LAKNDILYSSQKTRHRGTMTEIKPGRLSNEVLAAALQTRVGVEAKRAEILQAVDIGVMDIADKDNAVRELLGVSTTRRPDSPQIGPLYVRKIPNMPQMHVFTISGKHADKTNNPDNWTNPASAVAFNFEPNGDLKIYSGVLEGAPGSEGALAPIDMNGHSGLTGWCDSFNIIHESRAINQRAAVVTIPASANAAEMAEIILGKIEDEMAKRRGPTVNQFIADNTPDVG
jgi:hypothetical protein